MFFNVWIMFVQSKERKKCVLLQIALRGMKSAELSVRGSVEPPSIDISVVSVWLTP